MHLIPGGLGCCSFYGGTCSSVVVYSMLNVPPIGVCVCGGGVLCLVLVSLCITKLLSVLTSFAIILTRTRELVALL